MASVTELLASASTLLNDSSNVRWPQVELLMWLNDAQRAIVTVKPAANMAYANLTMAAGSKQNITTTNAAYWKIMHVTRNMGAAGAVAGEAITSIPKATMDALYPNWHTATTNNVVDFAMYDPDNVSIFWVYPPQPAAPTHKIEALVSVSPTDATIGTNVVTLGDIYYQAIIDYILYRAYGKDTETEYGFARGEAQMQKFLFDLKMVESGELTGSFQKKNSQAALAAQVANATAGTKAT
jgi:hypothetical protein